ncbi:MAG: recombinase RecT, partial [Prevotella sp.]|nr:recombinase RecT [Prevotella sp.]
MTQQTTAQQGAQQPQQGTQVQAVSQNATALKKMGEETCNNVLTRINAMKGSGELVLPEGYNAGNALKSAWLYLQTIENGRGIKAIDTCTQNSICNCLLEMCIHGEHPKKHCYFIPCGNSLEFWERYTGKFMRAKRDSDIADIQAQVIYEGDEFVYTVDELGRYQFVSHKTSIDNIDISKIKAAYAVVVRKNGDRFLEIMTMEQIRKAWEQGAAKGNSKAHNNFGDQMCKRTIISRACKVALDSSPDGWNNNGVDDSDDNFSMLPPDASEAERQLANSGGTCPALPNSRPDAFEATAEYEDVTDAVPASTTAAPKAQAAKGRECPVRLLYT